MNRDHSSSLEHRTQSLGQVVVSNGARPFHHGLADGGRENAVLHQTLMRWGAIEKRAQDGKISEDSGVIADPDGAQGSDEDLLFKPGASEVHDLSFGRSQPFDHFLVSPDFDRIIRNDLAIWD